MVILIETYWRRVGTLSLRNKGTSSPGKSLANSILTWHLCLAAWQTFVRVCVLSYFSHIRLLDCSPPGSSVHGILQARFLQNGLPCPPLGDLPRMVLNKTICKCLMAIHHSSILAWEIPWTEEPDGL